MSFVCGSPRRRQDMPSGPPLATKITICTSRLPNNTDLHVREFNQDVIKIGRLEGSSLVLKDDSVARMHAVIEVSGEQVRVIDLGSDAGTILNGVRVDKNEEVQHGDQLQIGVFTLTLRFNDRPVQIKPPMWVSPPKPDPNPNQKASEPIAPPKRDAEGFYLGGDRTPDPYAPATGDSWLVDVGQPFTKARLVISLVGNETIRAYRKGEEILVRRGDFVAWLISQDPREPLFIHLEVPRF